MKGRYELAVRSHEEIPWRENEAGETYVGIHAVHYLCQLLERNSYSFGRIWMKFLTVMQLLLRHILKSHLPMLHVACLWSEPHVTLPLHRQMSLTLQREKGSETVMQNYLAFLIVCGSDTTLILLMLGPNGSVTTKLLM